MWPPLSSLCGSTCLCWACCSTLLPPHIPHGLHMEWSSFHMDSTWNGAYSTWTGGDSTSIPYGIHSHSTHFIPIPYGLHYHSTWIPHGLHMDSTWTPHGL